MRDRLLQPEGVAATEAGHGVGGSDGIFDPKNQYPAGTEFQLRDVRPNTHGALYEGPPCGKCGCQFVNVGCPKVWPISTIALSCAKCGSIVTYLDGMLIMELREAFRENRPARTHAVRNQIAFEIRPGQPTNARVAAALVLMGIDAGLSYEDIAAELNIDPLSVQWIAEANK